MVRMFVGRHLRSSGSPGAFRSGGTLFPHGSGEAHPLMSRKGETANLDAVKAQHAAAAQNFDATRSSFLSIRNNCAHIERLNAGWSAQSVAGFFERAMPAAVEAVKGLWRLKELG